MAQERTRETREEKRITVVKGWEGKVRGCMRGRRRQREEEERYIIKGGPVISLRGNPQESENKTGEGGGSKGLAASGTSGLCAHSESGNGGESLTRESISIRK